MRIIGIDPGSVVCGYGVIDRVGQDFVLVEYGVVEAKKRFAELPRRLEEIYRRLDSVIERSLPDEAALESVFFAKNAQSLAKLSHARGVAMLATVLRQVPVVEYSAKQVKRAVTGNGNAAKEQVSYMVQQLLSIKEAPDFFDATDALAVAVCHALRGNERKIQAKSWKDFAEQNAHRIVKPSTRETAVNTEPPRK